MSEPNSFGNPILKEPEVIDDHSKTKLDQPPVQSLAKPDAARAVDTVATLVSPEEDSRLNQELAQVCVDTGATGAAIALVRGDEMVCHAASGSQAPGVGVRLDPHTGLSGACIQTRQLQQCKDTQTDSRVDAEVCRRLGVRSVVVLPLVDGEELFGIFEILSPIPNAFGQFDLDILNTLSDRIVERRRLNRKTAASVTPTLASTFTPTESGLSQNRLGEVVPPITNRPPALPSNLPGLDRISRKADRRTSVLGVLVIASALLLGMLVGWRLGWQKATLSLRTSSPFQRSNVAVKPSQSGHAVSPVKEMQPVSAETNECGSLGPVNPAVQQPSGGLTICEQGRVIFRSPPATVAPVRNLPTPPRTAGLTANTTRR